LYQRGSEALPAFFTRISFAGACVASYKSTASVLLRGYSKKV
jgi:hypothetical protein